MSQTIIGPEDDTVLRPGRWAVALALRQSRDQKHLVRVYYTAQTFDQPRKLTPLRREQPPETVQLPIPGVNTSATSLGAPTKKKR